MAESIPCCSLDFSSIGAYLISSDSIGVGKLFASTFINCFHDIHSDTIRALVLIHHPVAKFYVAENLG
jgi:hypothetical protein